MGQFTGDVLLGLRFVVWSVGLSYFPAFYIILLIIFGNGAFQHGILPAQFYIYVLAHTYHTYIQPSHINLCISIPHLQDGIAEKSTITPPGLAWSLLQK